MKYRFAPGLLFLAASILFAPATTGAAPQPAQASQPGTALAESVEKTPEKKPAKKPGKKSKDAGGKRDANKKVVKKTDAAAPAAAPQNAAPAKPRPALGARPFAPVVGPLPPPTGPETPELKAMREEINRLTIEKNLIDARLSLEDAKRRKEAASRLAQKGAEQAEEKARLDGETALEAARENARLSKQILRIRELETEAKILKSETENALSKHAAQAALFQKKQELNRIAPNAEPKLLKEPLVGGTLYISNRRVSLNGPVTLRTASDIIDRLNFLNNQSDEYPIFLVIDRSPGGSVAAGFQILKAMESSKAPVYVVVKGYAASMAAVITTLAKRSYCYDNTIILHHQMSTLILGNMGSLKDQLKFADQWYDRLATPVAKKMGLSLKDFTKQMYAHNADADWQEFGTAAQKLKWVDNIVEKIVETGIVEIRHEATEDAPVRRRIISGDCVMKEDEKGTPYMLLPVLDNPFDFWWLYDKRGFYRAQ
jgi:ATP-dependent Clp protease protease subunit